MNIKMVFKVIGRLLIFVALLMLLPAAVGLYYREEWNTIGAFLLSAGLGVGIGALLNLQKVAIRSFFTREGLVIVSLSWLLISFLGGLPLYLSGQYPTLADAFFEISSGFADNSGNPAGLALVLFVVDIGGNNNLTTGFADAVKFSKRF